MTTIHSQDTALGKTDAPSVKATWFNWFFPPLDFRLVNINSTLFSSNESLHEKHCWWGTCKWYPPDPIQFSSVTFTECLLGFRHSKIISASREFILWRIRIKHLYVRYIAETWYREEFNITWIQRKKRSGEREGRSHEEDQGKFQSEFTGKGRQLSWTRN